MKFLKSSILPFICLIAIAVPGQARIWTQQSTGKQIDAELDKVEDGTAFLRLKDGRVGPVKLSDLSEDDRAFIKDLETSKPADGWPQFRGPNRDGVSTDTGLLKTWPEGGPEKIWSYAKAGMGYSGFSVTGGKLYTAGTRGEDVVVICLNAESGAEEWSTAIGKDDGSGYNSGWGNGPRSTPTFSDGMIYALAPKGEIACLDAKTGAKVWASNLIDDFAGEAGGWGFSASPLVDGDKLILAPGGKEAGLVALNKKTGDLLWEASDVKPGKAEYATIIPATINGIDQYIRLFMKEIVAVRAESGEVVWRSKWDGATAVIPTPIVDGNKIFVGSGYGVGCKMIEIDSSNKPKDVWSNKVMKNHHGGFIKVGDYIYGFSDASGMVCQSWATGDLVWNEKDGQFLAKGAITIADGMIYALNEQNGGLSLIPAASEFGGVAGRFVFGPQSENRNPKGRIWTHPLVIGGKLYLRDQELIYCYDVKG